MTLAEVLKARGYVTGHVGKWHLGPEGFGPTDQGFDVNIAGDHTGTPMSYFAPFARPGGSMPGLEKAPEGEYLTDRLTDEAEKFIDANKGRPFFLYLPHYAPHMPMGAKPELVAKYPKWDGVPHGRQENPIYAAMLESLDESVGRVVAKLKGAGLSDRTIVIFTSDNGGLAVREGAEHAGDEQRAAARGQGLPVRGRDSRPADRELAGRDRDGRGDDARGDDGPVPDPQADDRRRCGVGRWRVARVAAEGRPAAARLATCTGTTPTTATRAASPAARSARGTGSWWRIIRRDVASCSTSAGT